MELQELDKEILIKFNQDLGSNKPLTFIEEKSKHPTWQNCYRLSLSSKHMSETLTRLGLIQNKSLVLTLDILNKCQELNKIEFLRGFWDGNGGFYINKLKDGYSLHGKLTSTKTACENIKAILDDIGVSCYITTKPKHKTNDSIRILVVSETQNTLNFMKVLYSNADIYLERKYNKYILYSNILSETGIK